MEDEAAARATTIAAVERSLRQRLLAQVLLVPVGVLAIVDLVAGSPIGDRRVDVGLLLTVAVYNFGLLSSVGLLRTLRGGAPLSTANRRAWTSLGATGAVGSLFLAAIGWLIAGWIAAVVLAACSTILWAVPVAWLRFRMRRRSA